MPITSDGTGITGLVNMWVALEMPQNKIAAGHPRITPNHFRNMTFKRPEYHDKAIYNRFGLRSGVMPVCVNTDDLGIFPTTLSNEFELLKIAARDHHGFGWQEVEHWADEIRRFGVKQFYRTHAEIAIP